ncbi:MAG: flagellin, partial [Phycisphaerales bacterium]|nr:flagellin [Phycisphaerales bacterium]
VAVSFDGSASKAVTITITGTNDVPVITGEDTGDRDVQEDVDASASGTLTIADVDDGERSSRRSQQGSATYSSYVLNADGTWTYTLDDTNATVQALSAGETMTDSFVAVSEDGTASATVTITITGTGDSAVITGRTQVTGTSGRRGRVGVGDADDHGRRCR